MRFLLVFWLVAATILEAILGFMLFVALGMSSMMFTSQAAFERPLTWFVIGGLLCLLAAVGAIAVIQWVLFGLKKPRAAVAVSLIPVVVILFANPLEEALTDWMRRMDAESRVERTVGEAFAGIWPASKGHQSNRPQRSFTQASTCSTRCIGVIVRQPNSASSPPKAK